MWAIESYHELSKLSQASYCKVVKAVATRRKLLRCVTSYCKLSRLLQAVGAREALIASNRKLLRAFEAIASCRKLLRDLVGFRKPLHTFARFEELLQL